MSHDPSSGAPSHDHRRHGPEGARRRPSRRGTRLRHGSIPSDWPCASPPARDADRRPLQRRPPSWRPAPRCRRQDKVSRSSAELPSGLHPQLRQPEPPAMCYLSSWRCSPERIRHPELNCSRRATPPSSKFNSDRDIPRFLRTIPFPLSYEGVGREIDGDARRDLISSTLRAHGGIRFPDKIAEDLSKNLDKLNADQCWSTTLKKVNALVSPSKAGEEREVARVLQKLLHGFGPKQSRNLLQSLGLTRYEIPIDSRITKWLNDFGF